MAVTQRQSKNTNALKKLGKLSDQLDTAKDASEATTKEVRHARRTADSVKRTVRRQQHPSAATSRSDHPTRTRKRSHDRYTEEGKSKAAVELGRKGGAARTKTLTRKQRSALATKAAKTRWHSHS
jgi:hypothetical protein